MSNVFNEGLFTPDVLTISADAGTNNSGDALLIETGAGDGTGNGGDLTIQTGISTGTGVSGDIDIRTGNITGAAAGDIDIVAGSTDTATGGNVTVVSGQATSTGNAGALSLIAGSATSTGNGGDSFLLGGLASGTGNGGAILVRGGQSTNGTGGTVTVKGGISNTATPGDLLLQSGGTAAPGSSTRDIIFQARDSGDIPLNEAAPNNIFNSSFFASSIIAALNELSLGSNYFYVNNVTDFVSAIATGGKILLAPGTYSLSATQVLVAGTSICGSGVGQTTITIDNALDLPAFTLADDVLFENLTLDGNSANQTNVVNFANGTSVTGITFNNVNISVLINYNDIFLFTDCNQIRFISCISTSNNTFFDYNIIGTNIGDSINVVFERCIFNNTKNNGGRGTFISTSRVRQIRLIDTEMNGPSELQFSLSEDIIISGCSHSLGNTSTFVKSIRINTCSDTIVENCLINIPIPSECFVLTSSTNTKIIKNTIKDLDGDCIELNGSDKTQIIGNTIENTLNFVALFDTISNEVLIKNNNFQGNGSSTSRFVYIRNIFVPYPRVKLIISENIVTNINDFINIESAPISSSQVDICINNNKVETPNTGSTGCTISVPGTDNTLNIRDNLFRNFETGINCGTQNEINIDGNEFIGTDAVGSTDAIELNPALTGSTSLVKINRNKFSGYITNCVLINNDADTIELTNNECIGTGFITALRIVETTFSNVIVNNNKMVNSFVFIDTTASIDYLEMLSNNVSGGRPLVQSIHSNGMDVMIHDNIIEDSTTNGISMTGFSTSGSINDNQIINSLFAGIIIGSIDAATAQNLNIISNIIDTTQDGITISTNEIVNIKNNIIKNCTADGITYTTTATGRTVTIADNVMENNSNNFSLSNTNNPIYNVQNNNATNTETALPPTLLSGANGTWAATNNYDLFGDVGKNATSYDTEIEIHDVLIGGSSGTPSALLESVIATVNPPNNAQALYHIDYPLGNQVSEVRRSDRITIDPYNDVVEINITSGLARIDIPDISSASAGHTLKINITGTSIVSGTSYISIVPASYENGTRYELNLDERTSAEFEWNGVAWTNINKFETSIELRLVTLPSIVTSTTTLLYYESIERNNGGFYTDSITSPTRAITVPRTGKYACTATIIWASSSSGFRTLWIAVNGVSATQFGIDTSVPDIALGSQATNRTYAEINLNAGDYIDTFVFQDEGTNQLLASNIGAIGGTSIISFTCTFLGN